MGLREQAQKRIDAKIQEIRELDVRIGEARAYVQALQDFIKLIPREIFAEDTTETSDIPRATVLRGGSAIARAREVILRAGKPLHVSEILQAIGKPNEKKYRISLSGNLSAYVRANSVFTRPHPNTFGLIELESQEQPKAPGGTGLEPSIPGDEQGLEFGKEVTLS